MPGAVFEEVSLATATARVIGGGLGDATLDRSFFGHPRGLSTLFFSEMWERFSYYGMRAFLILYMTAPIATGRHGPRRGRGGADLRDVHLDGVSVEPAGRLDRRSADSASGGRCSIGGILIARGPFLAGRPIAGDLLSGPGADRARYRPAQAQHQRHGRPALRREGPAARCRLLAFLHGHQYSAHSSDRSITGYLAAGSQVCEHLRAGAWIRTPPGTGDLAQPAWA